MNMGHGTFLYGPYLIQFPTTLANHHPRLIWSRARSSSKKSQLIPFSFITHPHSHNLYLSSSISSSFCSNPLISIASICFVLSFPLPSRMSNLFREKGRRGAYAEGKQFYAEKGKLLMTCFSLPWETSPNPLDNHRIKHPLYSPFPANPSHCTRTRFAAPSAVMILALKLSRLTRAQDST